MLERQEKMEIMGRLQIIQDDAEMSQEEMQKLLDAELDKREDEIDTEMVRSLLELLEGEGDADALSAAQQRSWKQIEQKLPRRAWVAAWTWMARCAAAAAVVIALFFATYQTAEALDWRSLLRWMQPLAEIFTLYSDSIPEDDLVQPQLSTDDPAAYEGRRIYGDGPVESARQQITDYADAPERLHGCPVKAKGIPARFTYQQGSVFSDARMTVVEYVFTYGDDVCLFKVRIPTGTAENPVIFHHEKTIAEVSETCVGPIQVNYYFNADDLILSASWTMGDIQYLLFGSVNQQEMTEIIDATMLK